MILSSTTIFSMHLVVLISVQPGCLGPNLAPGSHSKPDETGTGRCKISNCETGDIACDSYHNIERDVQSAKDLNLQQYRFSLSWARILPTGNGSSEKIKYDNLQ